MRELKGFGYTRSMLLRDDPVHRGKQLKPERSLEAVDQLGHFIEAMFRLNVTGEKGFCVGHSAWNKFKPLVGLVPTVGITSNQMAFDLSQNMPKVFGVWPKLSLCEAKL